MMLIIFECGVYPNITMFDNAATKYIVHMGHNGAIPGTVEADCVSAALEKIVSAMREEILEADKIDAIKLQDDGKFYLSIDKRARTLIQLLRAASKEGVPVMWYQHTDRV